jgi:hypothetical protein
MIGAEFRTQRREPLRFQTNERHPGAALGRDSGGVLAHPAGRPRDEHDLARQ